jgi:hypothetical protein
MNYKGSGRESLWPSILPRRLPGGSGEKLIKNFFDFSRRGLDSKWAPPEYRSRKLRPDQTCSFATLLYLKLQFVTLNVYAPLKIEENGQKSKNVIHKIVLKSVKLFSSYKVIQDTGISFRFLWWSRQISGDYTKIRHYLFLPHFYQFFIV